MKTYYYFTKKTLLKSFAGLLSLTAISCGSYQNKSYYDNDGIYGGERQKSNIETNNASGTDNKYKEYFSSNANNYNTNQTEVLTDVDNYSTVIKNQNDNSNNNNNYSGWGNNSNDHLTINVYDNSWGYHNYGYYNNYWGYNSPWNNGYYSSWNNGWYNPWSYYGSNWGWNNLYYGNYYGYNNYGYNNWNTLGITETIIPMPTEEEVLCIQTDIVMKMVAKTILLT